MAGPEDCLAHFLNLVQRIGETCENHPKHGEDAEDCAMTYLKEQHNKPAVRKAKPRRLPYGQFLNFRDMSQDLDSRRAPT